MNKVILSGHIGKDPEVTYLPDGKQVTKVTLATSNNYKGKDGKWIEKSASWHTLVAFGRFAEQLAEYRKGNKLEVEGKIQYRQWEDKGGVKHTTAEIIVFSVVGKQAPEQTPDTSGEDVPF